MFWKLIVTLAVVVLLAGRSGALQSPLVRLILPRAWMARLPSSMVSPPGKPNANRPEPPAEERPLLGNRAFIFLTVLAATAVVAWIVTRALMLDNAPSVP